MKLLAVLFFINVLNFPWIFPQGINLKDADQETIFPKALSSKIGSGELIRVIQQKYKFYSPDSGKKSLNKPGSGDFINLAVYLSRVPSAREISDMYTLGVEFNELSIPPSEKHPLGFFISKVPVNNLMEFISMDFIKRIETADELSLPQNNEAAREIKADKVWSRGFTGKGIKIAVLDSGLDTNFTGSELPAKIIKKDYSAYPLLDDDVANRVTGHGTHVTGSVLARGVLSENNTANGEGPYKGIAPDAELIFIKIGNDINGGANSTAIIEALKAAVTVYHADVITMSYGNWDIYHDGSDIKDQTVDWCYSQGVPVFIPAGNYGASKRHYSGSVNGNDSTDLIKVNVTGALESSTLLTFNLVWYDGTERKDLRLKYYNELGEEIPNIYNWSTTQSIRGTESKLSQGLFQVPAGNSVYYLKVINLSASMQQYHIYEHNNDGKVTFETDDPSCTIISPGTADHAFTVGSFVSRTEWISYNGAISCGSQHELESIYSYSSRGPRIDGLQKPNIVAPGSSIISLRDGDVYNTPDQFFIDNDGNTSGDYNYMVMEGTSMSAPFCVGAAALYLQKNPGAQPEEIYSALESNSYRDNYTGNVPNGAYGYGKLDVYSALFPEDPLPVQLSSFTAELNNGSVELKWSTSSEINNYGFEIERMFSRNNPQPGGSEEPAIWLTIGFVDGSGSSNSPKKYLFTDKNLYLRGEYFYRIKQVDFNGSFQYSEKQKIIFNSPMRFVLMQNFPNPFNPGTKIKYTIPASWENPTCQVTLKIYDIIGREIATLVNEAQYPGVHEAEFNPPKSLASGIYFYKLTAGNYTDSKKMVYIQ
ncbi:MAG TPA: S8 family peptidase [Ignavibacteriaceae bacterium]|nr:S8 family peptidase [Ignavibacteriaceae bacterium]